RPQTGPSVRPEPRPGSPSSAFSETAASSPGFTRSMRKSAGSGAGPSPRIEAGGGPCADAAAAKSAPNAMQRERPLVLMCSPVEEFGRGFSGLLPCRKRGKLRIPALDVRERLDRQRGSVRHRQIRADDEIRRRQAIARKETSIAQMRIEHGGAPCEFLLAAGDRGRIRIT